MSIQEKNFLKWIAGIATAVIIAMLINTFAIIGSVDVMAQKIETNAVKIQETKAYHEKDADKIGKRFNTFEHNQNIMREDIKDILKMMPK